MQPWFGLHLPLYTFANTSSAELFDRVVEQARAAESNGFRLVTVMDHLFTGFTFNNTYYKTPDQIALVGEVLQLVGG